MLRRARNSDHSVLVMPRLADIVGRVGLRAAAEIVKPVETALNTNEGWVPDYKLVVKGTDNAALQLFARNVKNTERAGAPRDVDAAKEQLTRLAKYAEAETVWWGKVRAAAVGVLVTELGLSGAAEFMQSIEQAYMDKGWASRYEFSLYNRTPVLWWSAEKP